MPAMAPRLATHQARHGEVTAGQRAMLVQRGQGVRRAGGFKPAGAAKPGAEQQAVGLDEFDHQRLQHVTWPDWGAGNKPALEKSWRNSSRTAVLSAGEAALGNRVLSKAADSRTT